jgi:ubiquinone/menaquinone biosynthesis C-methylase UbiE
MDVEEFDKFADQYEKMHSENVVASGESPAYFAEYKIRDIVTKLGNCASQVQTILDFGSGVGNSVPYFRKYFPKSALTCADVSQRSLDVSRTQRPGQECYAQIVGNELPFADNTFDLAFSACVFHHISHKEHKHWLTELHRVTVWGGSLFIFEHNPFNPLTVSAVCTCPFDKNAHLITGATFARRVANAKWSSVELKYRIFFPRILSAFRVFEPYLYRVPLGAQYYVFARK